MENQNLAKKWKQIIESCEISSLSKAEYCRQHQLAYHQYMYWQKQIQLEAATKCIPIRVSQLTHITEFGQESQNNDYGIIEYPSGVKLRIQSNELLHMLPQLLISEG